MLQKTKIRRTGKRIMLDIGVGVLMFCLIGISFFDFTKKVEGSIHQKAEQTLSEMCREGALLLETQFNRDMVFLRTEANLLVSENSITDFDKAVKSLQAAQEKYNFNRMAFIHPDGTAYTSSGEIANLSQREYFQTAMLGKETVSNMVISSFSGKETFAMAVPVYENEKIIGVLSGSYIDQSFTSVVNMAIYGGTSMTYVMQPDGTYVLRPDTDTVESGEWNIIDQNVNQIKEKMKDGQSGYSAFSDGKQNWQLCYVPTAINDWYVVTLVPENVILSQSDFIQWIAILLCVKIGICLMAWGFYVLLGQRKGYKEEQERQERLHLDNSRYRVLLENLEGLFFEWDLDKNTVTCSKEWKEQLGYEPDVACIQNGGFVREEEQLSFVGFTEAICGGLAYSEEEYQLLRSNGESFWCRIRLSGINNKQGEVRRIMGLIEDIDCRKQREVDLMNEARRDALTCLLNKKATEEQISFVLKDGVREGFCHVFMLLDIDDFKGINDNYGHHVGDQVLKGVADALVGLFRSLDIVGRIGGDEFVVFLRNVNSEDAICKKAEAIVEAFKKIVIKGDPAITCSLGITVVKESGENFEMLYAQADSAMYVAKKAGKHQFAFYEK